MKYLILVLAFASVGHADTSYCWATCYYKVPGDDSVRNRQITSAMGDVCSAFDKLTEACASGNVESHLRNVHNPVEAATMQNSCGYTKEQLDAAFGQP